MSSAHSLDEGDLRAALDTRFRAPLMSFFLRRVSFAPIVFILPLMSLGVQHYPCTVVSSDLTRRSARLAKQGSKA